MKHVLLTTFAARDHAVAASRTLERATPRDRPVRTRLHEGGVDVQLGIELSDTRSQGADERSVLRRFGVAFGLFLLLGVALDLLHVVADDGLILTMTLGSVGVLAGTLAVVCAELRPLDRALAEASDAVRAGRVLLSVTAHDDDLATALETVRVHGGRTIYSA